MPKQPAGTDVLTAARQRVALAFDNFDKVCVSYSAGKDSTVMMHLVMDEARRRGRRVAVLLIDLEAQYRLTIDHAVEMFTEYRDVIEPYWVALPLHLRNAVSVFEPFWMCWDPDAQPAWVRRPPDFAITEPSAFPFFHVGMEFEEFVPAFADWYSAGVDTAFFVGIRTQESYSRYLTIASQYKSTWDGYRFTTGVCSSSDSYNFYPLYDWSTEDVWTFHARNPQYAYNRVYDLMRMAGVSIHDQRICQPYGDDQRRGLWLYHLLEPDTWGRVVARVNGANSGSLYARDSGNVNGYRKVSKPPHLTWKEFAYLLVSSMPKATREHYATKIGIHVRWWEDRGYSDGIPDEADYDLEIAKKVPSWRRVCKTLLRNDYWCKGLGFTQQKSDAYRRYQELMRERRDRWAARDASQPTLAGV
jgi:predicted phosphoadenosine phosphosulfate sulfurtransferase